MNNQRNHRRHDHFHHISPKTVSWTNTIAMPPPHSLVSHVHYNGARAVEILGSSPEKEGQGSSGGTSRSFWRVSGMSWREGRGEAWVATGFEVALNCVPLFLIHPNNQNGVHCVLLEVSPSSPGIFIIQQEEDTRLQQYRISGFIPVFISTVLCFVFSYRSMVGTDPHPDVRDPQFVWERLPESVP
jgi:hypothetical protein